MLSYSENQPQAANIQPKDINIKQQNKKKSKPRILLKQQHFQAKNGLRSLYQKTKQLKLDASAQINIEHTMKKIVSVLKTWHFQMIPKYSFDYFIQRCQKLQNNKRLSAYMSKVRRIHKGQDTWQYIQNKNTAQNNNEQKKQNEAIIQANQLMNNIQINQQNNQNNNKDDQQEDQQDARLLLLMQQRDNKRKKMVQSQGQIQPYVPQGYQDNFPDQEDYE